jgi:glycerol uptake operon antiterminator
MLRSHTVSRRHFEAHSASGSGHLDPEIRKILEENSLDQPTLDTWIAEYGAASDTASASRQLQEQNRKLKGIVADLVTALRTVSQATTTKLASGAAPNDTRPKTSTTPTHHPLATESSLQALAPLKASDVKRLLEQTRIIPAIRDREYIPAATASPARIVWLLFGTPLTLGDIAHTLRSAGKLPVANLDLLTGFAQDADGVALLAELGISGIVSTRQSALRAARAHGLMAVQRTFIVDSIAVGNVTRSLQHFLPDAMELLPAIAAPLVMPLLRDVCSYLPVIATGLVTSLRQVEELVGGGVSSVATSNSSLWVA